MPTEYNEKYIGLALQCKILELLNEKVNQGAYIDKIIALGVYDDVQRELMLLEADNLITVERMCEIGEQNGDVIRAHITPLGVKFVQNGFSLPVQKISVTFDEEQLEKFFIHLAAKYGKVESPGLVRAFFQKFGNAGINALGSEFVKYMITNLPEIAKRLV